MGYKFREDDVEDRLFGRKRHGVWSRFSRWMSSAMKVLGAILLGLVLAGLIVLAMWAKVQAYGWDMNCLIVRCVIIK